MTSPFRFVTFAIVAVWYAVGRDGSASSGADFSVSTRRVASSSEEESRPAISPDGQWVVYSMIPAGDAGAVESGEPTVFPGIIAVARPADCTRRHL